MGTTRIFRKNKIIKLISFRFRLILSNNKNVVFQLVVLLFLLAITNSICFEHQVDKRLVFDYRVTHIQLFLYKCQIRITLLFSDSIPEYVWMVLKRNKILTNVYVLYDALVYRICNYIVPHVIYTILYTRYIENTFGILITFNYRTYPLFVKTCTCKTTPRLHCFFFC